MISQTPMSMLHAWQRHRGLTDDEMGTALVCSGSSWRRYRTCRSDISHEMLIRAINILRVPQEDAIQILTAGMRLKKEK